ncbi:bleomycin resistance protein [Myroides odoratus]|uniref:bleomycin resistance protein n=1 Tax=Myroides odoratus TaxID=256 RepID=UPI000765F452|nr:VOC family protein [Myroides odoratus]
MRSEQIKWATLVPELVVTNLTTSLHFWCEYIGFSILYERKEEFFAYLELDGAQLMLEQEDTMDQSWQTGSMEKPFGRGINFQIEVEAIAPILTRLEQANYTVFLPVEERWYRADTIEFGQKQFLVQDPDGYLVRLIEDLGERKAE